VTLWLVIAGLSLAALAIALGGWLIWHGKLEILNPIRAFAVLIVAVISGYVMVIGWRLIDILSSPDWCSRSIVAEKASPGTTLDGLKACIHLMGDQIDALAIDSHISQGVIAFCLLALIVIVIAGGRLNFKVDKSGASGSIGKDDVDEAADLAAEEVAKAAVEKKDEIKARPGPPPESRE
jgi:hypothetical protein